MNTEKEREFRKLINRTNISTASYHGLLRIGYRDAPASRNHHLNERGGLILHSMNVTRRLVQLTESLCVKWSRAKSPYLVGLMHDLVKCKCYRDLYGAEQDENPEWEYVQPEYPGHGVASVMIAAELGIDLNQDERIAITYHMGMFGCGKEYSDKEFNAAIEAYSPQIIATHCADWYAARVDEKGKWVLA